MEKSAANHTNMAQSPVEKRKELPGQCTFLCMPREIRDSILAFGFSADGRHSTSRAPYTVAILCDGVYLPTPDGGPDRGLTLEFTPPDNLALPWIQLNNQLRDEACTAIRRVWAQENVAAGLHEKSAPILKITSVMDIRVATDKGGFPFAWISHIRMECAPLVTEYRFSCVSEIHFSARYGRFDNSVDGFGRASAIREVEEGPAAAMLYGLRYLFSRHEGDRRPRFHGPWMVMNKVVIDLETEDGELVHFMDFARLGSYRFWPFSEHIKTIEWVFRRQGVVQGSVKRDDIGAP